MAQLVKAFDTHQEAVTKRSLEVTMNPATKPVATANDNNNGGHPLTKTEFPTGPNALRLFIPNIDIRGGTKAAAAKRTRGNGGRDDGTGAPSPDDRRKRSNVND